MQNFTWDDPLARWENASNTLLSSLYVDDMFGVGYFKYFRPGQIRLEFNTLVSFVKVYDTNDNLIASSMLSQSIYILDISYIYSVAGTTIPIFRIEVQPISIPTYLNSIDFDINTGVSLFSSSSSSSASSSSSSSEGVITETWGENTTDTYNNRTEDTSIILMTSEFGGDIPDRPYLEADHKIYILIKFDPAQDIVSTSEITRATINLYQISGSESEALRAYRMLQDWTDNVDEFGGGARADWFIRRSAVSGPAARYWFTYGAQSISDTVDDFEGIISPLDKYPWDRRATPEALAIPSVSGNWVSWNVTDLVRKWVSRTSNEWGVLIQFPDLESVGTVTFHSSKSSSDTLRPYLEINYRPASSSSSSSSSSESSSSSSSSSESSSSESSSSSSLSSSSSSSSSESSSSSSVSSSSSSESSSSSSESVSSSSKSSSSAVLGTVETWGDNTFNTHNTNRTTDSWFYEDNPIWNGGNSNHLKVGNFLSKPAKALIEFTPAQDTTGFAVIEALLFFYVQGLPATHNISAYRVLQDWEELQSTWNIYSTGNNWNTAGASSADDLAGDDGTADIHLTAIDTVLVDTDDKWYSLDITSLVQEWINGTSKEYGVLLDSDNHIGNINTAEIRSREHVDGFRPYLQIVHVPTSSSSSSSSSSESSSSSSESLGVFTKTWGERQQ